MNPPFRGFRSSTDAQGPVEISRVDIEAGEHALPPQKPRRRAARLGIACLLFTIVALALAVAYLAVSDETQAKIAHAVYPWRRPPVAPPVKPNDALPTDPTDAATSSADGVPEGFERVSAAGEFVGVLHNARERRVLFEVPSRALGVPFVVDALASKADGVNSLYHEPISDSDSLVFQFELSAAGSAIDLVRPNLALRARAGSEYAALMDDVAWTGWEETFAIASRRTVKGEELVAIDVTDWVVGGCGAMLEAAGARKARMGSIRAFPRNLVANVEYRFDLEDGGSMDLGVAYTLALLPATEAMPRALDDRVGYFASRYTLLGAPPSGLTLDEHSADKEVRLINRWRLEPSGETVIAADGRELAVPLKPITFHLDPSIPLAYRPGIARGIENWLPAFEGAGWHRAIRAIDPDDPDWPADYAADDSRYSTVSWAVSTAQTFSVAPSMVDPRTGEILGSDIMFTHSWISAWLGDQLEEAVSKRVANDAPTQFSTARGDDTVLGVHARVAHPRIKALRGKRAASAPARATDRRGHRASAAVRPHGHGPCGFSHAHERAHGAVQAIRAALNMTGGGASQAPPPIDEAFVLAALADVTMHEVGHALGLRHNFKGSAAIPWERIGDRAYTAEHGLSASVMDYLPTVVHSHASKQGDFFSSHIGAYDRFAIEYGYTRDVDRLAAIAARADVDPALAFGTDEDVPDETGGDPTVSMWDVSSTPLAFAADQLELARSILAALSAPRATDANGTAIDDDLSAYERAWVMAGAMRKTFSAAAIAAKHVGGIVRSRGHALGDAMTPVPAGTVAEALALLARVVGSDEFAPSAELWQRLAQREGWCEGVVDNCLGASPVDVLGYTSAIRSAALALVLTPERLRQVLLAAWALDARGAPSLPVHAVLRALSETAFDPALLSDESAAGLGRQLQRDYVAQLLVLARDDGLGETTVAVTAELRHIGTRIAAAYYAATLPRAATNTTGNATDVGGPTGPSEMLQAHWSVLGQLLLGGGAQ